MGLTVHGAHGCAIITVLDTVNPYSYFHSVANLQSFLFLTGVSRFHCKTATLTVIKTFFLAPHLLTRTGLAEGQTKAVALGMTRNLLRAPTVSLGRPLAPSCDLLCTLRS